MLRKRLRRSGQERRTGNVGGDGYNEQRARGFAARLPRCGHIALHTHGSKQENGEKCAADHPTGGNARENYVAGSESLVQPKITHSLDNSRKDKSEGQDKRGTVMRAAEADQGIGGVAEAEKCAATLEH